MTETPRVSLVVPTLGRLEELRRLFASLARQTWHDFDVVLVDQSRAEEVSKLASTASVPFDLHHVRCKSKGAAAARNTGLALARGEIVTFPDDDCWYPPGLLQNVVGFLDENPGLAGVTTRATDASGRAVLCRWSNSSGRITRMNEFVRSIEFTIFVRRSVVEAVGGFDPSLGIGAGTPWGAWEGDDLILRAMALGHAFWYRPDLTVHHPARIETAEAAIQRAYHYDRGFGRVLRRHRLPWWYFLYHVLRSSVGALLAFLRGDMLRSRRYLASARGRVRGWLDGPSEL